MSITISKASASQHGYYTAQDPYDIGPQRWEGSTCAALGLEEGAVADKAEFQRLFTGLHPQTGGDLVRVGANGEHVAGWDVQLAPPKSVSIVGLVLDREDVREAVEVANRVAMRYAEDMAMARQTVDGVTETVPTGNLVYAATGHAISRSTTTEVADGGGLDFQPQAVPGDPQLHYHNIVQNVTIRHGEGDGKDGVAVALESQSLYKGQKFIGMAYNSELVAQLKVRGYGVALNGNGSYGSFEISGVPQEVIREFSKRSGQVLAGKEDIAESYPYLHDAEIRKYSNYATRGPKDTLSKEEFIQNWSAQLEGIGHSREGLFQSVREAGNAHQTRVEGTSVTSAPDHIKYAATALADEKSYFSKGEVLALALRNSRGDVGAGNIRDAFAELSRSRSKELVAIDGASGTGIDSQYTTREFAAMQRRLQTEVSSGYSAPVLSAKEAREALQSYLQEQRKTDPSFHISEADAAIVNKVLTSTHPNILINVGNELERTKARELISKIYDIQSRPDVPFLSGPPASDQQHNTSVESIRRDLSRDAALRELDRKHDARQAEYQPQVPSGYGTGKPVGETRAILNVDGGREELLYREKKLNGYEIRHPKRYQVGMVSYSVKQFSPEEKAARKQVDSLNERIRTRKLEDAQQGILNVVRYHESRGPAWSIAVGGNRSYVGFGGARHSRTNQKVWFGADRGNTIKRHRTEHYGSYTEQVKTYDAKTGVTREIKSRGSRSTLGYMTLMEQKTSTIVEKDRNGNKIKSTSKTSTFLGRISGTKITKNADGTTTVTRFKGYEKTDIFGRKTVVITHREVETKAAKPSLFVSLASAVLGGRNSKTLSDYAANVAKHNRFAEVRQEGRTTSGRQKFNAVEDIAKVAAAGDYARMSVLTYSRARANALNVAVRQQLVERGIIGAGQIVESLSANHREGRIDAKRIEVSKGDRVRLTDTNKVLGIRAGETGIIRGIDGKGNIHIALDRPRLEGGRNSKMGGKATTEVFFNVRDYRAIEYNYATTSSERPERGKLVVDYHTRTANKDFLTAVHKSVKDHGGEVRILTDNRGLAQTQVRQYDQLREKYAAMVEEERKGHDLIGKMAIVVRRVGGMRFTTANAEIVGFDNEKNIVQVRHRNDKGVIVNRTYAADHVRLSGEKLVLPESQVGMHPMFSDTVFARTSDSTSGKPLPINHSNRRSGASDSPTQEKGGGITITSAETHVLSPLQASKMMARMEKESSSDHGLGIAKGSRIFHVIDSNDPRQVLASIEAHGKVESGARNIVIGLAKHLLGQSPEQLQKPDGKYAAIIDTSKHPEVQEQKMRFCQEVARDKSGPEAKGRRLEVREGKAVSPERVQEPNRERKSLLVDVVEHGIAPAAVDALLSSAKGNVQRILDVQELHQMGQHHNDRLQKGIGE